MFRNFWRKSGDCSKAEVEHSPSQSSSVDYEMVLFALLDEVERRSEFSRGWIRGFLELRGVTREALAEWLRGFGERLQSGEEHQELGERLLRLGRLDEGELCRVAGLIGGRLERECPQAPKDEAEAWWNRGNECYRAGDFEGAISSYDKVLNTKPDLPEIWIIRGIAFDHLGRYEDAIASFDKVLDIKPDYHTAWLIRGDSLHNLGRDEEAVASFDKALDINPDYYAAWTSRGNSLNILDRYEEAITSLDKALDIKSDLYEAWFNRGISLDNLGRHEEAISNYDQGLTCVLKEANPEGWGNLQRGKGNIYFYQAQNSQNIRTSKIYYSQAVTVYNTARQTLESFPRFYLELIQNLITTYIGLGDSETADQWRIKGLEVFRQLLNAQSTPLQKRNLETKFSSFSRIAIDRLLAQGETIVALETAERYKNRCLTWILDEWKEQVISPSYAEILQLLDPQTAIVYWHFSDESLTTFILTPTSEDPIVLENPLPYDRAKKLQSWIKSWNTQYNDYRTKKANQADHSWRKALSTQLTKLKELLQIQTIESHLPNIQNLILLPHRDLHRFPLHALFSESLTVSYLPSIQIGLNLNSRSSDRTSFLLNVEDPDRGNSMPFAQLESVILKAMFAPNTFSIPPEKSDRATVESALKTHHGIFHFTGHANYNDRKPENSELALKNSDTLTAKEISSLDLKNYHLVILSACETALNGTQSIDTEYVGLTSAFLQAGVSHIISTLWTVEEASNAYLMIRFYQFWQAGQESAIALRSAQNWLRTCSNAALAQWLKDLLPKTESDPGAQEYLRSCIQSIECKIDETDPPYRDPYYWAAFTHTGL